MLRATSYSSTFTASDRRSVTICLSRRNARSEMQKALIGFGNYVLRHWSEPDEGLWEPRTGRQHHTHSRFFAGTALDRVISLSEQGKLKGADVDEYRKQRDSIRQQISTRAVEPAIAELCQCARRRRSGCQPAAALLVWLRKSGLAANAIHLQSYSRQAGDTRRAAFLLLYAAAGRDVCDLQFLGEAESIEAPRRWQLRTMQRTSRHLAQILQ